jgi:xanthine dehydrogenase accessory factor
VITIIRGGGDLGSGVALRLHRAGFRIIVTELPEPLVVRRYVSFAETIYRGEFQVEGITAHSASDVDAALDILRQGFISVLIDPQAAILSWLRSVLPTNTPVVLIDARMGKKAPDTSLESASLVIGLGPGFVAGQNCHAVVETNRGHHLGRVIWEGAAESDTGLPESVAAYGRERVLRSPADGVLIAHTQIGERLEAGQLIAEVDGHSIRAPFKGVLRGLLHPGLRVTHNLKIGDVDPRDDPRYCFQVSDKALAIGGGVLEAVLSRSELRPHLWD